MRLLVTGGCGFIGANFIRLMLERHPDWRVTNVDCLSYAGNPANCRAFDRHPGYRFVHASIANPAAVEPLAAETPDAIVNFAAETHVDRSIFNVDAFIQSNIHGTYVLLEAARRHRVPRYIQISTDEVYGSLGPTGYFTEESPIQPNSPYSASKAAGDMLVRAYVHTYGFPGIITRCSNNYGPNQYPEKLLPFFIGRLLRGGRVPLYGDGNNVREWTHVDDHNSAVEAVLLRGRAGEVYNIGSGEERSNRDITRILLDFFQRGEEAIEYVADRPGHDRRYGIDSRKIREELGWQPRVEFTAGMQATIRWYVENAWWWETVKK